MGFEGIVLQQNLLCEILCTGAFLYVPYSFLLISNNICTGGEQYGNVTLPHWRGGRDK
jgi:hypothetical protein